MNVKDRLNELGYEYSPAPVEVLTFHSAVRHGSLVYTSGQIPLLGDMAIKGKVGAEVDLGMAQKAAEICAFNCLRAVGAVCDIESVERVVKVLGMVNTAPGFNDTSSVINGCSEFLTRVFGDRGFHARSAVGMVLPGDWAVEVEMVVAVS
ncbi:MAG TPA: RidA family protein [Egibacteraceae bacterium]|nr:RidA family protein [Egibacteraceae bacterium]